jgi:60 kDa SS-A/Ro ribonucleoprotein
MRTNTAAVMERKYTHEGAIAYRTTAAQELRRSVMACMLFESSFYESGIEISDRISSLVKQVDPVEVAVLAIQARNDMKLRHAPLLLVCEMAKLKTHRHLVSATAYSVIQRADELAEILSIYSRGRTGTKKLNKLSKQLQAGVAAAFTKFDEYSLAKYNQGNAIKLRDVLFAVHAKPLGGRGSEQDELWKRLVSGTLATPDTWEVALSATKGEGKKEAWERLLREKKLGAMALLRNLRNMQEAGVADALVREALLTADPEKVLPFRFVSAARYAPKWEPELEQMMFKNLAEIPKLHGKTLIVIDNSASMYGTKVSEKSEIDRSDAACALAILLREVCQHVGVISFSSSATVVPARRGFALRDAIKKATSPSSTMTDTALALADREGYDRIIVITDEQSHQTIRAPKTKLAYFINVSVHQNGIGYGKWCHLDGWSENVLQYILASEAK